MMLLAENPTYVEMKDIIDQMQLRKGELDDIIYAHERPGRGVNPEKLKAYLEEGRSKFEERGVTKELIKQHVTKVITHPDELIIEVGVHISGSGGRI